jgi:formyl-CoA transferase
MMVINEAQAHAPLRGLQVLDLSQGIAASFTARVFADLGAEVTRVESGDDGCGPREVPAGADAGLRARLEVHLHAGKRRIAVAPAGHDQVASRLARGVDLVIEDSGRAFCERLALLEPAGERATLSLSAFGWEGPYASWRGGPLVVQALGGILALTGLRDREPLMLPGYQPQYCAGLFGFIAAMTMLHAPEATGRHAIVTELEAVGTLHQYTYLAFTRMGWVRKRDQSFFGATQGFRCTDGRVVTAPARPAQWEALAEMCGRRDLIGRPEYATTYDRRNRAPEMDAELASWFAERSAEEAFKTACEWRVPAAIVNSPERAVSDPQFAHRGFPSRRPAADGMTTIAPLPFLLNGSRPVVGDPPEPEAGALIEQGATAR